LFFLLGGEVLTRYRIRWEAGENTRLGTLGSHTSQGAEQR
jgi:hypothetical protein